ncbi:MAG: type VI secretion system tip protein VgrG [Bacteroidota bacterium]
METHVKTNIELGGQKKITAFKELTINQSEDQHHSFELRLPLQDVEGAGIVSLQKSKDFIGKPIKIEILPEKNSKQTSQFNQFNGIITDIKISRFGGNTSDLIISGYSPTIILDDGPNTRSFSEKTVSQIINEVLKPYPKNDLICKVNPVPDVVIPFLVQYNESNFNFLQRITQAYGQWSYYNGRDYVLGGLESVDEIELNVGQDLLNFELGIKLRPLKYKATSYQFEENKSIEHSSSQVALSGLDQNGSLASTESDSLFGQEPLMNSHQFFKNLNEQKDFYKIRKSYNAAGLVIATGVSVNPKLKVGSKISIQSAADKQKENYGSYTVINVTHYTDGMGIYQNNFEAVPSTLTVPPKNSNFITPVCGVQPATVKDNNDPDKLGRVRVQFFWQKSPEKTPWIRLVTPHTGKNKGFQFIPEVGDEVLVAFENNNPDAPYIIGSLYHGKASHSDRFDKDNYVKTIRTVSNNEIKFYDKPGEETITIHNKDSANIIVLDIKNDKIFIKSNGTIQMEAKDITIDAEKTIKMKADEITVSSKSKMLLESENSFTVKNKTSKMESQSKAEIKSAGKMEINAAAGLDVDGGPKASLTSSAQMEIKSGVVMIN